MLALAQAQSADAAIQQAKGAGDVAVLGKPKIILQQMGNVAKSKPANQARDLARHLRKRGFMMNVPISWLKHVLWRQRSICFLNSPDGFPEGSPNSYAVETEEEETNPSPYVEHLQYG